MSAAQRPVLGTLSPASGVSVSEAATAYIDTIRAPTTRRVYTHTIGKTALALGPDRALADVEDIEVGAALHELWGTTAANTWNSRRSTVSAWLEWCRNAGFLAPRMPSDVTPRAAIHQANVTRIHSRTEIDRLTSDSTIPTRETTLWRMLYETAAPAVEVLDLNIEDLDLANRRAQLSTTSPPRRADSEHKIEPTSRHVSWGPTTERLLTHHLQGRTAGPVFVASRPPHHARRLTERDVDPGTGFARLTRATASHWLDRYTAEAGRGTGWTLHELRASARLHNQIDRAIAAVAAVVRSTGDVDPWLADTATESSLPVLAAAARDLDRSEPALAPAVRPLTEAVRRITRATEVARAPSLPPATARQTNRDLTRAIDLSEAAARVVQAHLARAHR